MSTILQQDRQSITAAVYHLKLAVEHLDSFRRDCHQKSKGIANMWHKKADWILSDIFCSLDEKSRELFRQEIQKGDPVFMSAMALHLLAMSPEQRALIEKVAEAMAGGEELEFVAS